VYIHTYIHTYICIYIYTEYSCYCYLLQIWIYYDLMISTYFISIISTSLHPRFDGHCLNKTASLQKWKHRIEAKMKCGKSQSKHRTS